MGLGTRRFWRPKLAIAVSFALVIHNALVLLLATQLSAAAVGDALAGAELCLHSTADTVLLPPIDEPGGHNDQHCLSWCLAAHHSLAVAVETSHEACRLQGGDVLSVGVDWQLPRLTEYSIARPRGPPLRA
jgi:hypothetical protein